MPRERVDAVVAGDELGMTLAEELERARAVRHRQPGRLAARARGPALPTRGRWGRASTCASPSQSGGRARAGRRVRHGAAARRSRRTPVDATFALEVNEWSGAVEPRLVLRHALRCEPGADRGRRRAGGLRRRRARGARRPAAAARAAPARRRDGLAAARRAVRDRRDGGIAGIVAALVHTGEPVLLVVRRRRAARAAARRRSPAAASRCARTRALRARSAPCGRLRHVVVARPAARRPPRRSTCWRAELGRMAHLAWGATS